MAMNTFANLSRCLILSLAVLLAVETAQPCSWAVGYFHQVTSLRGTLVGMSRGWPRWIRQYVTREGVTLRLYEYRWPLHDSEKCHISRLSRPTSMGTLILADL